MIKYDKDWSSLSISSSATDHVWWCFFLLDSHLRYLGSGRHYCYPWGSSTAHCPWLFSQNRSELKRNKLSLRLLAHCSALKLHMIGFLHGCVYVASVHGQSRHPRFRIADVLWGLYLYLCKNMFWLKCSHLDCTKFARRLRMPMYTTPSLYPWICVLNHEPSAKGRSTVRERTCPWNSRNVGINALW